jgi:hypothetical protein
MSAAAATSIAWLLSRFGMGRMQVEDGEMRPEGGMAGRIGIVWRGTREMRETPPRLVPVFQALEALGLAADGVPYDEETSAAVRTQLLGCDGVLVWVDPLDRGRDRGDLDRLLREVAATGVWVSAHPDVILKIGTKEILYTARNLSCGGDTALYRGAIDFRREFPPSLAASGTRVLKQYRGNGGQGVWKVVLMPGDRVRLQEATHRDGTAEELPLAAFLDRCEGYFAGDGRLIDQAFQRRIVDGMVRCYMCGGRLAGFARQFPPRFGEAITPDETFGLPAAKTMLPPDAPEFRILRQRLEAEWTPQLCALVGLDKASLPALWDADFLFGPGNDQYVLCEINASCVTPFPPEAPAEIAQVVASAVTPRQ